MWDYRSVLQENRRHWSYTRKYWVATIICSTSGAWASVSVQNLLWMLTVVDDWIYNIYVYVQTCPPHFIPHLYKCRCRCSPTAAGFNCTSASRFLIKRLSGQDTQFAVFGDTRLRYIMSRLILHAQEEISTQRSSPSRIKALLLESLLPTSSLTFPSSLAQLPESDGRLWCQVSPLIGKWNKGDATIATCGCVSSAW